MSRDEAFLCFLRGAAGRAVRITFWLPRLPVKVPCQYLLFCTEISLSPTGFTILPRSLGSSEVLFDWLYKWGVLEPGIPSLFWLSVAKCLMTSPGHFCALAAVWGLFCSLPWTVPYSGIILSLMMGNIEQISDVTSELPISLEISIFWLDYPVLRNYGALEEALEIPPWSTQLNPFRGHSLKLVLCCHWQIFSKQPKENHRSCDFLKGHFQKLRNKRVSTGWAGAFLQNLTIDFQCGFMLP